MHHCYCNEMVSAGLSRSATTRLSYRTVSINSPRFSASAHRKWLVPGHFFNALVLAFFLVSLVLVLGCVLYLYWFRYLSRGGSGGMVSAFTGIAEGCDVFEGNWVPSDSYPLYNSSLCPFIERGFNCLANGRRDTDYLRWRWRPRLCEVPRFDAFEIRERLRGKRIVFVGDSMSRTQWESLICLLMTGVEDPQSVYEINGNNISKTIQFLGVQFRSYNFTVEFFRSVFLVQQGPPPRYGPKRVKMTLKLDKMDNINRRWVESDILIFNSGHWWTPTKLFDVNQDCSYKPLSPLLAVGLHYSLLFSTLFFSNYWLPQTVEKFDCSCYTLSPCVLKLMLIGLLFCGKLQNYQQRVFKREKQNSMKRKIGRFPMGCYFQVGGSLKLGMSITSAFRMALETWASWVESTINTNKTHVFFRTFEPSHWSGSGQKNL